MPQIQKRPSSGQDPEQQCTLRQVARGPALPHLGLRPQLVSSLSLPSKGLELLTRTGHRKVPTNPATPKPQARPGQARPPRCQFLAFWFTFAVFSGAPPAARCLPTPAKIPGPSWLPRARRRQRAAGGAGLGREGAWQEHSQATAPGQAKQTRAHAKEPGQIVHK